MIGKHHQMQDLINVIDWELDFIERLQGMNLTTLYDQGAEDAITAARNSFATIAAAQSAIVKEIEAK